MWAVPLQSPVCRAWTNLQGGGSGSRSLARSLVQLQHAAPIPACMLHLLFGPSEADGLTARVKGIGQICATEAHLWVLNIVIGTTFH